MSPASCLTAAGALALLFSQPVLAASAFSGGATPRHAGATGSPAATPVAVRTGARDPGSRRDRRFRGFTASGVFYPLPSQFARAAPAATGGETVLPRDETELMPASPAPSRSGSPVAMLDPCAGPAIYQVRPARGSGRAPRIIYGLRHPCGRVEARARAFARWPD